MYAAFSLPPGRVPEQSQRPPTPLIPTAEVKEVSVRRVDKERNIFIIV
jgi:hypothetical protein